MIKLKIGQKTLALLLIISLLPLAVINTYWLRAEQSTLREAAAERLGIYTTSAADHVEQFIDNKVKTVILHSQTSSVQQFEIAQSRQELSAFMYQDSDLERVALVDIAGLEQVAVNREGIDANLKNVSNSNAFRAATFLAGKEYISDVTFDDQQQPFITIAVPMVAFETRQIIDQLSTAERGIIRNNGDIKGVLVAHFRLNNLWQNVLSERGEGSSYAYVVDAQGRLIAHPDASYTSTKPDLRTNQQVAEFLRQPTLGSQPKTTMSERGEEVLSAHAPVLPTGWAVIAQEPTKSIFAPANEVAKQTIFIFIISAACAVLLSIIFTRNLTKPIRGLVAGTSQLGKGHFDMRLPVKSSDEIGVLAERFNTMASNLQKMIGNLKTETTKLNVILDSVGEGIIAIDGQNHIVLANVSASVLAGTLPSELHGKDFNTVYPFTKHDKPFKLSDSNNKIYKEIIYVSPSKRLHYLDIFVNKIEDDPSGIRCIITLRDQTSERELEMMKLDFVSMAAHELRTPITAIRGYLGLLTNDEHSDLSDASKQFVIRAQSSTKQLVGLINNLLNVSKIERGALNMNFEKLNWTRILQETVRDHMFNAQEKAIELRYEGPSEDVYLLADEVAIKEVISNLIANAIHYTAANGRVTVSMKLDGENIVTAVQDNGSGIPANALPRLFTKFYRVKGGIASGSGGTGLGLYISKSIVEMHKGTIAVDSVYGEGTTFTFTLPQFSDVQYNELAHKQNTGVNKRRGWVTKNIAR